MNIFIQIASYRDKELFPTICQAIARAARPEHLSFGICCQDELTEEEKQFLQQTPRCRVIYIPPLESRGCCYARSLTQSLWQDEEYTLQIDSHTRFVQDWDVMALQQLQQCPSDKPLLTAYCPDYQDENSPAPCSYTLGADYFGWYGMLMILSKLAIVNDPRPLRGAFLSGHFLFVSSSWIKEVPYDPNLYFHGEEITLAVRSWTKGWDIFYPNRPIAFHQYQRVIKKEGETENRTCHWDEHNTSFEMFDLLSQRRCRILLGMEKDTCDFGPYGLGEVRSLKEYEAFSGVDFAHKSYTACAFTGLYETEPFPLERMRVRKKTNEGKKVLSVTAFQEPQDESGEGYRRNTDDGIYWFKNLAALSNLELVCYCEAAVREKLPTCFTRIYDLELPDTLCGKYAQREDEIKSDKEFRRYIWQGKDRIYSSVWESNWVPHSKAGFLQRAAHQFPNYTHYAWFEFDSLRYPVDRRAEIDWSFLPDDRIYLQSCTKESEWLNIPIKDLCLKSSNYVSTLLIVVPAQSIDWLAEVYEAQLQHYHSLHITDIDQHLFLQLAGKYPNRFQIGAPIIGYSLPDQLFVQPAPPTDR